MFKTLINQLDECVCWKDTNLVYQACNQQLANHLGLNSAQDIVGKSDKDLPWPRALRYKQIHDDKEILESGLAKLNYEELHKVNNLEKVMLVSKLPIFDDQQLPSAILVILKDISDEQIKQTAPDQNIPTNNLGLQQQIELLRRQATTLAHELRTPLGSIMLALNTIEKLERKLADTKIKSKMLQATQLLKRETIKSNRFIDIILENVRDLSRITIEEVRIKECLQFACERFPYENESEKQKIRIFDINNFVFNGNQQLMVHLLLNLLKNAFYFINAAGKGEIFIWTAHDDQFNYLHFKDTGLGMKSSKAKTIFEEFFSDTGVGTGVGLFFCKNVMDSFGGDIQCEAEENEYAHFIMKFPIIEY